LANTYAQNQPVLSAIDRTRLAEAFRLDQIGERVWPGWSKAPFAVLLVTPDIGVSDSLSGKAASASCA